MGARVSQFYSRFPVMFWKRVFICHAIDILWVHSLWRATLLVYLKLRGLPGHRTFSVQTRTVLDKPAWLMLSVSQALGQITETWESQTDLVLPSWNLDSNRELELNRELKLLNCFNLILCFFQYSKISLFMHHSQCSMQYVPSWIPTTRLTHPPSPFPLKPSVGSQSHLILP